MNATCQVGILVAAWSHLFMMLSLGTAVAQEELTATLPSCDNGAYTRYYGADATRNKGAPAPLLGL
jgi:hypothetical protein